jgi:putative DNA primase/helicase
MQPLKPDGQYDLEEIKRNTDMVALVSHYIPLNKRGADWVGLCPVHGEKTPSFHVTKSKGFAYCYGCGAGFDAISFLMEMERIDLRTACERLTGNISWVPKLSVPPGPPPAKRITSKPPADAPTPSMSLHHLGEPIQIYALKDVDGSLICYEARYNDPKDKARIWTWGAAPGDKPRWACGHPTLPRPLYGLDRFSLLPADAPVLITEGPKKADSGHRLLGADYVSLSWTGGANRVKEHDYTHLAGRTVLLWPDADRQICNSEQMAAAVGCGVGDIIPYEHQPGPKAMYFLGKILHDIGCQVRLVNVQGTMSSGWDIADAEADGWGRNDVLTWLDDRVRDYQPNPHTVASDGQIYMANPRVKDGKLSLTQNHYGPRTPPGSEEDLLASVMWSMVSDEKMEPIRWLWPGRIARGKISLLVGDPGLGKSQVCASIASVITTGGVWPVDRTSCGEPGSVLIMSAEDDVSDTIAPRLEAAGADRWKVARIRSIKFHSREDDSPAERVFSVTDDLARLTALLNKIGDVRILIIDPISAYMGTADSYKNSEVRGMLTPLMNLAHERKLAVLLVSHLTKAQGSSALMRVQGSVALPALARAVWGIAKDPEKPERRLLMPLKNNLGKDNTGLAYTIESATIDSEDGPIDTSFVMWEPDAVTMTTEEAFEGNSEDREEKRDAKSFLKMLLAHGPVPSKEVEKDAKDVGYNMQMLHRLKKSLGIEVKRLGRGWCWQLEGAQVQASAYRDRA